MSFLTINKKQMKLKKPTTAISEVLFELLTKKYVSNADLPFMWGFRARISALILKYKVEISTSKVSAKNKHGRAYSYARHTLTNKKQALEVYKILTK